MANPKLPVAVKVAAALLITSAALGRWWQPQPVGASGRAFLAMAADHCPAAAVNSAVPTVADTAHALDRWTFARLTQLVARRHQDRCRLGEPEQGKAGSTAGGEALDVR